MSNVVEMSGAVFTRYHQPLDRARAALRSNFCYHRIFPKIVAVVDANVGGTSVTNDAENVMAFLKAKGALNDDDRLIYRDSFGRWDEIVQDRAGAPAVQFRLLGAKTIEEAIKHL